MPRSLAAPNVARVLAALAVAIAAGLGACAREPAPAVAPAGFPEPPDRGTASLLLVTLDTFRADAAGCGGEPDARTPWLDRLVRTGIQFETGLTTCPLTLPAHATMLTGEFPPRHGVRSNGTFRLGADVPVLTERLGERGFATGAFLAAFALSSKFGLDRGFDVYDDAVGHFEGLGAFEMARRPGDVVADAAIAWAGGLAPGARRFEWLHLFDAHRPHDAPAPWKHATGDAYRAEVGETDAWMGRRLRALALEDGPAWVIVLGDHGESEGDHGEETHGLFVYDAATMAVPAVIWPTPSGERPGVRRATFRTVDLPATVGDLLALDPDAAPGEGRSALADGERPAYMESLYPYLHHGWSDLRAVREGRWKYIRAPEPELYDLVADPGELDNLHDEHPDEVERLAERLEQFLEDEKSASLVELDEESRAALESLGYVTGIAEGPEDGAGRLDPKRMIRVNSLLMAAMRSWGEGGWEVARSRLGRALSLDPRNKEVHKAMGMLFAATGEHALAVEWYRRCLDLPPQNDDPFPRAEMALSFLQLNRVEDALRELEIVIELDPENASNWNNLAVARMRSGRPEAAREAWRRALEIDPTFETARESLERSRTDGGG